MTSTSVDLDEWMAENFGEERSRGGRGRGVTILSEVEKDEEIKESDEEAMQTNVEVYLPEELGGAVEDFRCTAEEVVGHLLERICSRVQSHKQHENMGQRVGSLRRRSIVKGTELFFSIFLEDKELTTASLIREVAKEHRRAKNLARDSKLALSVGVSDTEKEGTVRRSNLPPLSKIKVQKRAPASSALKVTGPSPSKGSERRGSFEGLNKAFNPFNAEKATTGIPKLNVAIADTEDVRLDSLNGVHDSEIDGEFETPPRKSTKDNVEAVASPSTKKSKSSGASWCSCWRIFG